MKQQTAVEYLFKMQFDLFEEYQKGDISISDYFKRNLKLFEQAKEIEKQQLISFGYTQIQYISAEIGDCIYNKVPEQIYNETYDTSSQEQ